MIGDGGQNGDVKLAQVHQLIPDIRRGADRGRVGGSRPEYPPASDLCDLKRPPVQIGSKVLDQQVDLRPLPHDPRQIFARHRRRRSEQHRLDPAHPFPPAQCRRQIRELAIQIRF